MNERPWGQSHGEWGSEGGMQQQIDTAHGQFVNEGGSEDVCSNQAQTGSDTCCEIICCFREADLWL